LKDHVALPFFTSEETDIRSEDRFMQYETSHEHPFEHEASRPDTVPIAAGDQRLHPRYELSLAITMKGDNNFYAGLSENISEGGVFIATHHVLPIGTPVTLSFTLPTADTALSVFGTVQWVRGPDATASTENVFGAGREIPGVMPGLGVQFHGVAPDALRAIREFVKRRSPVFFDA
jgi:uncharacterized protein (TIGR02266 family)